jgi:tellurite resistance-related uncharacterized protein
MPTLPPDAEPYHRSAEFTEETVPDGLLHSHTTKAGVWGRIVVLEGSLRYRVLEPTRSETTLDPGSHGIIEPQVPHEVEPLGAVRFFVEFLRCP